MNHTNRISYSDTHTYTHTHTHRHTLPWHGPSNGCVRVCQQIASGTHSAPASTSKEQEVRRGDVTFRHSFPGSGTLEDAITQQGYRDEGVAGAEENEAE